MFGTDYLQGSFEFETELSRDEAGNHTASAMGESVTRSDPSQALNDLNSLLNDKMERGLLRPDTN